MFPKAFEKPYKVDIQQFEYFNHFQNLFIIMDDTHFQVTHLLGIKDDRLRIESKNTS